MRNLVGKSVRRYRSSTLVGFGLVSLVLVSRSLAYGEVRRRVTLDDLLSLKSTDAQMDLSPNGETLAYVVNGPNGEGLWLVSTTRGTPRSVGQGFMPRWSPDGARLAFYSGRSGTLQLWILDVKTSRTTQITGLIGGINPNPYPLERGMSWDRDALRYCWSPDGAKIVFTSQWEIKKTERQRTVKANSEAELHPDSSKHAPKEDGPLVLTTTSPASIALGGVFRADPQDPHYVKGTVVTAGAPTSTRKYSARTTSQLFILDVASRSTEQLTRDDDHNAFNPDWSPDGKTIVYASTKTISRVDDRDPSISNISVIDTQTKRTSSLTTGPGEKRRPYWSPNGKWIAYLDRTHFGRQTVFVMSDNGGDPVDITLQLDRDVGLWFYWSPDSRSILLSCRDGVSEPILRIQVSTGQIEKFTPAEAYYGPFAVSRTGALAWVESDGSHEGVFYIADSEGQKAHVLLDLNPQIKAWSLGEQEVVEWKNSRGETIQGILINPADYHKGRTYPLIVDPYSYQSNRFMSAPMDGNQGLASNNYAVFFPNHRAPHMWTALMKDEAYSQVARGPKGIDIMVDDVLTGIDTLIKGDIVDPQRMCLYGMSNGAVSVNLLVTRTSRFKCAVSAAGSYSDWPLVFFLNSRGSVVPDFMFGGETPWDNPEAYTTLSPIYQLDKVTTPMLLAVGDQDLSAILPCLEMYQGLRYLHREVTLLRYPNQGHGFTGTALKDYWQRVNAFFDQYLKPDISPN